VAVTNYLSNLARAADGWKFEPGASKVRRLVTVTAKWHQSKEMRARSSRGGGYFSHADTQPQQGFGAYGIYGRRSPYPAVRKACWAQWLWPGSNMKGEKRFFGGVEHGICCKSRAGAPCMVSSGWDLQQAVEYGNNCLGCVGFAANTACIGAGGKKALKLTGL